MSFYVLVLSPGISLEDARKRIEGLDAIATAIITKNGKGKNVIEAAPAENVSRSKASKEMFEGMKPYGIRVDNKPVSYPSQSRTRPNRRP